MIQEIRADNFTKYMKDRNQHNLDKIMLVSDERQVTYGEFFIEVEKFAGYLKHQGFKARDRIVFADDESIEYAVALFGCWQLGITTILISHKTLPVNFLEVVEQSDCKAVFVTNKDFISCVDVQVLGPESEYINSSPSGEYYTYDPDEMVLWFVSSGTTGKQKMIVHRHLNLLNVWNITKFNYDFTPDNIILSTPKLSFGYGFTNLMISMGIGMTYVITKKLPSANNLLELIDRHQITCLFTNPTVIVHLTKQLKTPITNRNLKMIVSGSDYLPKTVSFKFVNLFSGTFIDIYGLAECMQEVAGTSVSDPGIGTIGKPCPGVKIEIRRDDGSICDRNETGMIWVHHPYAATLYWNNYAKTKEFFQGYWLRTGDLGYLDKNNNINYVCRFDAAIKIKNEFVTPNEVETLLITYNGVRDCVVNAIQDDSGQFELEAKIVSDESIESGDLRRFLSTKLESHKIPKFINFVDSIDKTVTGKTVRHKLAIYN